MKKGPVYLAAALIAVTVFLSFSEKASFSKLKHKKAAKAQYQTVDVIFQSSKSGQGLTKVRPFNWPPVLSILMWV
tara:strand:+ start:491 stop:715 length:225 start_codon:yes stop_codon:yes gene_type:complete